VVAARQPAQPFAGREPVEARHQRVEHDDVGLVLLERDQRLRAVLDLDDLPLPLGERRRGKQPRDRIVVDEQHAVAAGTLPAGTDR
jgi:hypothetical protein